MPHLFVPSSEDAGIEYREPAKQFAFIYNIIYTSIRTLTTMQPETRIEPARLRERADEARRLLKTLANTDRLMLLCQLSQGEMNVGELERELGIEQPTLSQQLAVLRREDLVATRREGKQIYYRLTGEKAVAIIETLYEQFCA